MSNLWLYLSRATGIVATVLIVLALAWGLFFSARATGSRRRPNWWLDLHKYLGGLAFVFTLLHVAATHASMVRSSRHGLWFQATLALLAGLAVYPAVLRLARVANRSRTPHTRPTHTRAGHGAPITPVLSGGRGAPVAASATVPAPALHPRDRVGVR